MDHQWFDNLTRALAPVSRRDSLKVLGGSLASRLLPAVGMGVSVLPSRAAADERSTTTTELLSYEDAQYRFKTIPIDVMPPAGWEQPAFDESGFQFGKAAFGSGGDCPLQSTVNSIWPINSQLLIRTVVFVPPAASNLRIMVSVDNDILGIFFDGQALANTRVSHEGCPIEDELQFDVPPSAPGAKLVAFHLLDRGDEAFFDARILADVPILAAVSDCSEDNIVEVPCNEIRSYQQRCGVICPGAAGPLTGTRKRGKSGCTFSSMHPQTEFPERLRFDQSVNCLCIWGVCASFGVTVEWVMDELASDVLDYQPPAVCCDKECRAEMARIKAQLLAHEHMHQEICADAVSRANQEWATIRRFTGCGSTRAIAEKDIYNNLRLRMQLTRDMLNYWCGEFEPPGADWPDCGKCVPQNPRQTCVNGVCVEGTCRRTSSCPIPGPVANPSVCRCNPLVDCSQRGRECGCAQTVEGGVRCGRDVHFPEGVCGPKCDTSNECERKFGPGYFCAENGTNCCPYRICMPPC
jgi:hypothetical protein